MQVQDSTNRRAPGLVNFVPALAYHFCLNLPAAFTQPGARLLVEPCTTLSCCFPHRINEFLMDLEDVDIGHGIGQKDQLEVGR